MAPRKVGRLWAVGDLQGCLSAFQRLLEAIHFDPTRDRLWLTGDLVNRGPQSLETLRLCYQLRDSLIAVLGNHDLHLLAVAFGGHKPKKKDTLGDLLAAPDAEDLLQWVRHLPLVHLDESRQALLVHAGLLPSWTAMQARELAAEVEAQLRSRRFTHFLEHMYGNQPDRWDDRLSGVDRLRVITNVLTRMRFVSGNGVLDMQHKGPAKQCPPGYQPWFAYPRPDAWRIFFGHWAALQGESGQTGFQALDTGAVWGGTLRALDVDRGDVVEVPA